MHACAHPYTLLILVRGLARAAPVWGASHWPRKGKRPQPHCLPPGPPPRPAADRTKQALSAVATVSHPAELGSVLGKWPPALCQGQHWPRVGNKGGCFPGVRLGLRGVW